MQLTFVFRTTKTSFLVVKRSATTASTANQFGDFSMALFAYTSNPAGLLLALKKATDQGHVQTWAYDKDGDFTHTPAQWNGKAWLRPTFGPGYLRFHLLGNQNVVTTWAIYGVFHGRFVEELIAHFHDILTDIKPTVQPLANVDECTMAVRGT
jgi:hypothetical protein